MRKKATIAIGIGVVVLTSLRAMAPFALKTWIQFKAKKECEECFLEIGDLDLGFIAGTLKGKSIRFQSDPKKSVVLDAQLDRIEITIDPMSVFSSAYSIEHVQLEGLDFRVKEDLGVKDSPSPKRSGRWTDNFPPFKLHELRIAGSDFRYTLVEKGGPGTLHVSNIQSFAENFASRPALGGDRVKFELTGSLNGSGKALIRSEVDLHTEMNRDSVLIRLTDQKLGKLNGFFEPAMSISFQGVLELIEADLQISRGNLSGQLRGTYRDLEVDFKGKSGWFARFVKEAGADLLLDDEKLSEKGRVPTVPVMAKRARDQGLFKFLLTGLEDAALKLVRRSDLK